MDGNRRIVVTGASRGLGREMVRGVVERGHQVFGCSRSLSAVEDLRNEFGAPHEFEVVDVGNDEQVASWAAQVNSSGAPDLVLNNAALINENAPLWEVPPQEFQDITNVNINGVFFVIRHFVPAMIDAGRGVIVNFSSGWGRSTSSDVAPYCASKFAIEGLTGGLAADLPSGLAAVALNPGIIHTDMLDSCFGASASSFPTPAKWAKRAVPFLLNLSASDNGASLNAPA